MATVNYSTISDLGSIHSCVYNDDLTRMVVCTAKGRVQMCDRLDNQQLWQATTDLPIKTKSAVTQVLLMFMHDGYWHMSSQAHEGCAKLDQGICEYIMHEQVAWAHSEHGSVVACGSDDGPVTIWQQAQSIRGQNGKWIQRAILTDSLKPITCLQFAPAQLGPQLAVASDDGFVRFYEATAALNAESWRLSNDLQVCLAPCCNRQPVNYFDGVLALMMRRGFGIHHQTDNAEIDWQLVEGQPSQ